MKNNYLKASASLLIFGSFVFLFGCDQTNKSKYGNNQNETAKDTFAIVSTNSESYETKSLLSGTVIDYIFFRKGFVFLLK
jgi:hypothetical protein